MSLDLNQVSGQIDGMAASLKAEEENWKRCLGRALEMLQLQSADVDSLRKKIEGSRTTWLVAGVSDELAGNHRPLPCPTDFTVIASDGSHIDVDRHSPARCYLINIGSATLLYGQNPDATLRSQPTLYASKEDMTIVDPLGSGEQPVEGGLLGIKRAVSECLALAELGEALSPGSSAIALLDGSLIMWGLGGRAYPEYIRTELLKNGLLTALDKTKEISLRTGLALASYISLPRSTEVVNALRIAICPYDPPDCDRHCPRNSPSSQRECDAVAGIRDRDLFGTLLEPGERSATFASGSSVMNYYGDHEIRFFYLKADGEIARVEFPRWVEENGLIDLLHTLILDQCRRGQGYPVALSESHEQAVVTGADREQFRHLIELALAEHRLLTITSEKDRSKRTRWI
ncbi:MAG: DNA double-strand break repair nuclease NurA [Gammaproteobacteria bacterium]|nr:DNA double-strand break repair nuclease NurA [Gammaproteobacteria bacterium]